CLCARVSPPIYTLSVHHALPISFWSGTPGPPAVRCERGGRGCWLSGRGVRGPGRQLGTGDRRGGRASGGLGPGRAGHRPTRGGRHGRDGGQRHPALRVGGAERGRDRTRGGVRRLADTGGPRGGGMCAVGLGGPGHVHHRPPGAGEPAGEDRRHPAGHLTAGHRATPTTAAAAAVRAAAPTRSVTAQPPLWVLPSRITRSRMRRRAIIGGPSWLDAAAATGPLRARPCC